MSAVAERHGVGRQHVLVTWPGASKWHVPELPADGSCPPLHARRVPYLCGLSQDREAPRTVVVTRLDDCEGDLCLVCRHAVEKLAISREIEPEGGSQ